MRGSNYPETECDDIARRVTVRVTESTIDDLRQLKYQLTHESVHCLSPRNRRDTLFFEEGLANWYTLTQPSLPQDYRQSSAKVLPQLLAKPYEIFKELNPTYEKIASLRTKCPGLDDVTTELIIEHFAVPREFAEKLMERLPKERPQRM